MMFRGVDRIFPSGLSVGFKSYRRSSDATFHSPGLLLLLLLLLVLPGPYMTDASRRSGYPDSGTNTGPSAADCSRVQKRFVQLYKGLPIERVPGRPMQGNHLDVCGTGPTCCSKATEQRLIATADEEFRSAINRQIYTRLKQITSRRDSLNGFMKKILNDSYDSLHKMFAKTYGYIYLSHSSVFKEFYQSIKLYFRGDKENIGKHIDNFFLKLQGRMVVMMEKDSRNDKGYRQCLLRELTRSRPFGDVPDNIKSGMRRTLVTSRTFIMVLSHMRDLLEQILDRVRATLSRECTNALTRMNMCSLCAGVISRPCSKFCNNVMRGCLYQLYDIIPSWQRLIKAMRDLAQRMSGPLSIEINLKALGIKVSDGIMNFQKSYSNSTRMKLRSLCRMSRGKRSVLVMPTKGRSRDKFGWQYNKGYPMTMLIRQIEDEVLKPLENVWTTLMTAPCKKAENHCWNGTAVAAYEHAVVGSSLSAQVSNQEVAVDLSRKDPNFGRAKALMDRLTNSCSRALYNNEVDYIAPSPVTTTFPRNRNRNRNRNRLPTDEGSGMMSGGAREPTRRQRPPDRDAEASGLDMKPMLKSTNGPTPVSRPDKSVPIVRQLPPDDDDQSPRVDPAPGSAVEGSGLGPTASTGQTQRGSTRRQPFPTRNSNEAAIREKGGARQPTPTAARPSRPGEKERLLPQSKWRSQPEGSGGWSGPTRSGGTDDRWDGGRRGRPRPGPGPDEADDRLPEGSGMIENRRESSLSAIRTDDGRNWPVDNTPYPSEVWVPKSLDEQRADYKMRTENSGADRNKGKPNLAYISNRPCVQLVLILACTVLFGLQSRNDG